MLSGFRATAVALALVLAPAAGWAVSFTGPSGPVTPGGAFSVTGVIGDDGTVGFDLMVEMDAGLTLTGVAMPGSDPTEVFVDVLDPLTGLPAGGTVLITVSSIFGAFNPADGAVTTVTLDFLAPSGSSVPLSVSFSGLRAFYGIDANKNIAALDEDFGPIEVSVTLAGGPAVIPLPAAAPLLMTGLAGLGVLGARRRRAA
jgi:hypothetical protein